MAIPLLPGPSPLFTASCTELTINWQLTKSKSLCDWRSVSKSWCRAPSGAHDQIFITVWQLRSCFVGRRFWREYGSVICTCCCPFPALSFLGPSPFELVTIFYCLWFETSLFVASYNSQGHGGGIRPRLHTGSFNLKVKVTLWLTVSQSVGLGVETSNWLSQVKVKTKTM
jgi:hypothetical protein